MEEWKTSSKEIAVIGGCMERGLNKKVDQRIKQLKGQGYEVVVIRTAGGNIESAEHDLSELSGTGRVRKVEWYVHEDCGFAKAAPLVLRGVDPTDTLTAPMKRIFHGMTLTRPILNGQVETHLKESVGPKLEKIFASGKNPDNVEFEISMVGIAEITAARGAGERPHHLAWATPSDIMCSDIATSIGKKTGTTVPVEDVYVVQGSKEQPLLFDLNIALTFVGAPNHRIRNVFVVTQQNEIDRADYRKHMLERAPFIPAPNSVHEQPVKIDTLTLTGRFRSKL